jgi:hypothetical protein
MGTKLRGTIKPPDDGLPVITLLHNDLDVWVLLGEILEMV